MRLYDPNSGSGVPLNIDKRLQPLPSSAILHIRSKLFRLLHVLVLIQINRSTDLTVAYLFDLQICAPAREFGFLLIWHLRATKRLACLQPKPNTNHVQAKQ